jgi:hypothetical protein
MAFLTFTPLQGMLHVVPRFLNEASPDRAVVQMGIRDALHFDLSPFFHPAESRVLASFEPCRLGGATGRGAEPHGSSSAPARCIAEALNFA